MNKIALSAGNLTKIYSKNNSLDKSVLALNKLNLEVKMGEIFGLLPVPNDQLYYFYLLSNAVRADLDEKGFEQIKASMIRRKFF